MVLITGLLLTGCEGLLTGEDGTGELALFIADAPGDVSEVNVTLEEVRAIREDEGETTITDFDGETKEVDLLELQFAEELLGEQVLPAGDYKQIRLIVAADEEGQQTERGQSYVVYEDEEGNTTEENIFIPSGMQTGLKINYDFTIEEGIIKQLLLDIDVDKMLHEAGESGKIILAPTAIRVIDLVSTGSIEGRVVVGEDEEDDYQSIDNENYEILVELWEGTREDEEDPITSTTAILEEDEITEKAPGSYLLRGLDPGQYTVGTRVVEYDEEGNISTVDEYTTDQIEEEVEVTEGEITVAEDLELIKDSDEENNDD